MPHIILALHNSTNNFSRQTFCIVSVNIIKVLSTQSDNSGMNTLYLFPDYVILLCIIIFTLAEMAQSILTLVPPTDLLTIFIYFVFTIPGMAYSLLAAMPPIVGLYVSFFPGIIYFFFGTSKHVNIGKYLIACPQ